MTSPLTVVVTGASGHLGSHLVPELLKLGFPVVGIDMKPSMAPPLENYRYVQAGLSDIEKLRDALAGAGLIVHCASLHPQTSYTDAQYLEANIQGTWHLYTTAAELGISDIVLTSSIAATGYGATPDMWPVGEDRQFSLGDLYNFTKHAQEDIARLYAELGKVRTIALRPPAFFPLPSLQTGFNLTGAFAIVQDIVAAHIAAVKVMAGLHAPPEALRPFEAFFVTNKLPYITEDAALIQAEGNMKSLVRKYWPQAYEKMVEQGYESVWLPMVYDISKAERLLSWQPAFNFEQWFAAQGSRA